MWYGRFVDKMWVICGFSRDNLWIKNKALKNHRSRLHIIREEWLFYIQYVVVKKQAVDR